MNKYNGLLDKIAKEFCIEHGKTESDESWKARIVYSLLGRMACASLFDLFEEDETAAEGDESVSITHFKRRIHELLDSYLELYPEIRFLFTPEKGNLCREIYDIYLKTGCIYHTPYRISPSAPSLAGQNGLWFERGSPLNRRLSVSGLGTYSLDGNATVDAKIYASVQEMFSLQTQTLSEFWDTLLSSVGWQALHAGGEMEYLPHSPPFYSWKSVPEKGEAVSLLRIGQPGTYLYYLYRLKDKQLSGSPLPQWLVNDPFYGSSSYRMVSNACLASLSRLPKIQYQEDGPIVKMRMQYLLPPAELYWVKLYSWPQRFYELPNDFTRTFSLPVFLAVKAILEQIGYQFTEE